MDIDNFTRTLPALFADFPHSIAPLTDTISQQTTGIDGLSDINNMTLLNAAAAELGPGECYVEAGSFEGKSAISAAAGNAGEYFLLDDFSMSTRERLESNIRARELEGRLTVIDGDAVTTMSTTQFPPIGVFYYDADHSFRGTLLALRGVRFHLAHRAVILVDDADWPEVRLAVDRFILDNPEASLAFRISGRTLGSPGWWHGVDVLSWRANGRQFDRVPR